MSCEWPGPVKTADSIPRGMGRVSVRRGTDDARAPDLALPRVRPAHGHRLRGCNPRGPAPVIRWHY